MKHTRNNKCPNCGAPIATGETECGYCNAAVSFSDDSGGVVLEGIKCPKCSSMNPPDSKFCSECSTKLLVTCKNCNRLIPAHSKHCHFCGRANHSSTNQDTLEDASFQEAVQLTINSMYAKADAIFRKKENLNINSDSFYGAWATNYIEWAKSFDSDITMHNFSREYRKKARNLLSSVESKFPNSNVIKNAKTRLQENSEITSKKSGCFVATAVYGNDTCQEVCILRSWRDSVLNNSNAGRCFVQWYYRNGPLIALLVKHCYLLKLIIRRILSLFVRYLASKNRNK